MAKSTKTVSRRSVTSAKAGRSAARAATKAKPKPSPKVASAKAKRAAKPALKPIKAKPAPKRATVASTATAKRAAPKAEPGAIKGKWVYTFGGGKAEGAAKMKNLLGGKGANLAEMANLGLPVPPGFTITTEVCTYFYAEQPDLSEGSEGAGRHGARLCRQGDGQEVRRSERSAAGVGALRRARLDAGHDGHRAQPRPQRSDRRRPWRRISGDRRFAFDSYRRFINMYSNVVLGIGHHNFEEILDAYKESHGYKLDTDLNAKDWENIVGLYKKRVEREHEQVVSRRTRTSNCGARSAPCSARG